MGREREFSDPVVTSVRAERADIELAKALDIKLSAALRNGIRNLAEGYLDNMKECPGEWKDLLIHLKKRDYEETEARFRSEEHSKIIIAEQIAIRQKVKDSINSETALNEESTNKINWNSIPEDQKIAKYIQVLMPQEKRQNWIEVYHEKQEEDKESEDSEFAYSVATEFAKTVLSLYAMDPKKPVLIKDLNQVRKVLYNWAESVKGFA